MREQHFTVTIDGPSASGKSTVAKLVASKLGYDHLDTGAIYRSIAWWIRKNRIQIEDDASLSDALQDFSYSIEWLGGQKRHFVGEEDVTSEIRTDEIALLASQISSIPKVRELSDEIQKEMGAHCNIVVEGRDAGSVVFPHADAKFFLIANNNERARRRFLELVKKYPETANQITIEKVKEEMQERDERDRKRKYSPLKRPADAVAFDTTHFTPEQIADKIVETIRKQEKKKANPIWSWLLNEELARCPFVHKLFYFMTSKLLRLLYHIKVIGVDNIPKGKAIIAPNHVSFLDPPVIGICIPYETHALAQEYLFKVPILKYLLPRLSAHPITGRTADKNVIKTIVAILNRGKKVVIFPEGARSLDGKLAPLKKGIGMIAATANSPIVPTVILGAHEIWPRGTKFPKLRGKMTIIFGKPLHWPDYESKYDSKKDAQAALLIDLELALQELLNKNNDHC